MTASKYNGPLVGLNVIDFGHYYAGPMVAMLLADQGANVIRVVRPGGAELGGAQYRVLNRNKKLLTLDIKTDKGKARALSLIARADIVIENFRPGVMERLGLDYASVKTFNQGLIYLSLPGFPSADKKRAHLQAWEGVMGAAAGVFTESHLWRQKLGFPPVYSWVPMCSAHGSMQGAIAVLAALAARLKHNRGTWIEVSQVTAAMAGFSSAVFSRGSSTAPDGGIPEPLQSYAYEEHDSEEAQMYKLDRATRELTFSPMGKSYPCADGREIMLWVQAPIRFAKAMGINRALEEKGVYLRNEAFQPTEWNQTIEEAITQAMLTKTAWEWDQVLREARVASSVILTREEWLTLEPARRSGLFVNMDDGDSSLVVPGDFADVSGPDGALLSNPFNEPQPVDFAEIDCEWQPKNSEQSVAASMPELQKGDLLKGVKVLDLTNLVAGPTATYTLAQYGAEVIKADPPDTANILIQPLSMLEVNQGKRSILTEVRTAPGREVLRRLVCWADVVVHNSIDGFAERLGVTLKQLQDINPDVVVCQFSAYGGVWRGQGGWEARPGFDPNVQCSSGMMIHYGTQQSPQSHGTISCGDIMGGIGGSFAALLGLYQKRQNGHAGEARCSLARMINYIQLPGMIMEHGRCDWGEARGQFTLGDVWYNRMYQCRDQWIFVQTDKSRSAVLFEMVTGKLDGDESDLETAFAAHDCAYWQERLEAVDIGSHVVATLQGLREGGVRAVGNDAFEESTNRTAELLIREQHPCGEPTPFIAPSWIRVSEQGTYKVLSPTPRYGKHTREILKELGYRSEQIEQLINLKVCHDYHSALAGREEYFWGG